MIAPFIIDSFTASWAALSQAVSTSESGTADIHGSYEVYCGPKIKLSVKFKIAAAAILKIHKQANY